MASVLVTGGAGFIGANFVHYWLRHYPNDDVIVYDALTYAGNLANLSSVAHHPNYRFIRGDISDKTLLEQVLKQQSITTVVNFAAETHVDRSIHTPEKFFVTNVLGTQRLLEALRTVWLNKPQDNNDKRFHHISTDEVYGSLGPNDPAFKENSNYVPNSPYAASKAAADHLVRAYYKTYGLPTTISACSNNYGPYQNTEKLIPLLITNALQGKPLPIYGDGNNIRDWIYVEDHCRGIDLILNSGQIGENYNIGSSNEKTNIEIAHSICALIDEAFANDRGLTERFPRCPASQEIPGTNLICFVPDRLGHDRRYGMDFSKINDELKFIPQTKFELGMRKTIEWYIKTGIGQLKDESNAAIKETDSSFME